MARPFGFYEEPHQATLTRLSLPALIFHSVDMAYSWLALAVCDASFMTETGLITVGCSSIVEML
jgi:hypothetical protein